LQRKRENLRVLTKNFHFLGKTNVETYGNNECDENTDGCDESDVDDEMLFLCFSSASKQILITR